MRNKCLQACKILRLANELERCSKLHRVEKVKLSDSLPETIHLAFARYDGYHRGRAFALKELAYIGYDRVTESFDCPLHGRAVVFKKVDWNQYSKK